MAEANALVPSQTPGAPQLPMVKYLGEQTSRQLMLIISMALAIALGAWLFMNFSEPAYRPLYSELSGKELSQVVDVLTSSSIPYKMDESTGVLNVPAADVHRARLVLAAQGLPKGSGTGFELLEKDQGFGTSQFIENARYHHALEAELARTISEFDTVRAARVHLALPKKSVFVRDQNKPSASVMLDLATGRGLTDGQVASIVHMVASSVPDLQHEEVTVVDQRGNLLSNQASQSGTNESTKQFEYRQMIEKTYVRRIESLLEPILGQGKVRAQVNAEFDFSATESTQELFDADGKVIRSEQLVEALRDETGQTKGIPGALSNQPPGAGSTTATQNAEVPPVNISRNATRNYEVGKTIRHVRGAKASLKRLSVAVLLDQKDVGTGADLKQEPFSEEELTQIRGLIRDAVGFIETRGDSIQVMNAPFVKVTQPKITPIETPIWEEPYVIEYARIGGMIVLGLLLYFLVARPAINGMLGKTRMVAAAPAGGHMAANTHGGDDGVDVQISTGAQGQLPGQQTQAGLPQLGSDALQGSKIYESKLQATKQVVDDEPALVANIVKNWLNEDDS